MLIIKNMTLYYLIKIAGEVSCMNSSVYFWENWFCIIWYSSFLLFSERKKYIFHILLIWYIYIKRSWEESWVHRDYLRNLEYKPRIELVRREIWSNLFSIWDNLERKERSYNITPKDITENNKNFFIEII